MCFIYTIRLFNQTSQIVISFLSGIILQNQYTKIIFSIFISSCKITIPRTNMPAIKTFLYCRDACLSWRGTEGYFTASNSLFNYVILFSYTMFLFSFYCYWLMNVSCLHIRILVHHVISPLDLVITLHSITLHYNCFKYVMQFCH